MSNNNFTKLSIGMKDVTYGKNVKIVEPLNLYSCILKDDVFVGPFVEIQKNVIIDPVYSLYIPDAFSPNDDGLNDVFLPVGRSIVSYHLRIFNRWGEEIFISDNINYGWNGELSNNSIAEPGYYNYIIKIVDEIGTSHKRSGIVLLN